MTTTRISRLGGLLLLLISVWAASAHAAEVIKFTTFGTAYKVNGKLQPPLSFKRGETYTIEVDTPGHPLWIKTAISTGQDHAYSKGVTGNGATSGNIIFAVPADAPAQLYYNCEVHPNMYNTITITD